MTDRPIIFSAPMIRALLAGRKSQTRRLIRNPEYYGCPTGDCPHEKQAECYAAMQEIPKPYDRGDRLYVREAWKPGAWRDDGRVACDYRASPDLVHTPWCYPENFADLWPIWTDELIASGSSPDEHGFHHWEPGTSPLRWRPSIHMPRWASRLTLLVTDVRVQRVQDISGEDAITEGIQRDTIPDGLIPGGHTSFGFPGYSGFDSAVDAFAALWNSLHDKPGERWDDNPWIVAVSFETIRGNIDEVRG